MNFHLRLSILSLYGPHNGVPNIYYAFPLQWPNPQRVRTQKEKAICEGFGLPNVIRRGKYNEWLIFGQMEGFNYGNLWTASSLVLESQEFKNLDG